MNGKDKIIQSALKIFVTRGLSASTNEITKDAGVSEGLLFRHFPTKNDLMISLYEQILVDYFRATVLLILDFHEDDPEKYRAIMRHSWETQIRWSLENWSEFQYKELIETSFLFDQFQLKENTEFAELNGQFLKIARYGIEHGYLKKLPDKYLVDISKTVTTSMIRYLRENEPCFQNKDFMEQSWQIFWGVIVR